MSTSPAWTAPSCASSAPLARVVSASMRAIRASRQQRRELFLEAFGAASDRGDVGVAAVGAGARHRLGEGAVVAAQRPVLLVEDAPGAAVRAAAHPAAFAALEHRCVAAPVEEDQALLAARDALAQRVDDLRREPWRHAADRAAAETDGHFRQPSHVDQSHARPGGIADAVRHRQATVVAGVRPLPRLERWRRRAQHDERSFAPAAPDSEVARRVARPFLLLVRGVVLLVDNDQAEPWQAPRRSPAVCRARGRRDRAGPRASCAGAAPASARCAGRRCGARRSVA